MKRYFVWCPEYGQTQDDAFETEKADARAAALEWAKDHDEESADYAIANGDDLVRVVVCEADHPERHVKFIVSGVCVPQYSARVDMQP